MGYTMRDVAARLGVSVTTVSKVLNGQADIGEETRARVLAKVAELGYRRNAVARSLTLRRTHTLGVIVPDLMHSFFVEIVAALEAALSLRGYGLLVCNLAEDPAKERPQLETLLDRQVDGVILASSTSSRNADVLERLATLGKGLVLIDRDDHTKVKCHRVLTDDVEVGRLGTEHLIRLGHRRIAYIAGGGLVHARRRMQGYQTAMKQHDLPVQADWVVQGGFLEEQGYDAARRLLKQSPEVTALVAVNDPAAIGAMKALWEAGLRVPQDLSVVGAGDIRHGDLLRVPLATVTWSREAMGARAATLIVDQIESQPTGPFERVIVPAALVPRESAGAPRAK